MAAGTYDIVIDQGSTFKLTLTVKEGAANKNLDNYFARGKMRPSLDSTLIYEFDFTGVTLDDSGVIEMKLPHNATSTDASQTPLAAGKYVYDVEIYKQNNDQPPVETEVQRLIQGSATVRREVTR